MCSVKEKVTFSASLSAVINMLSAFLLVDKRQHLIKFYNNFMISVTGVDLIIDALVQSNNNIPGQLTFTILNILWKL